MFKNSTLMPLTSFKITRMGTPDQVYIWELEPYTPIQPRKLNVKISTGSKLVGVDDDMPQVVWTAYFIDAQG